MMRQPLFSFHPNKRASPGVFGVSGEQKQVRQVKREITIGIFCRLQGSEHHKGFHAKRKCKTKPKQFQLPLLAILSVINLSVPVPIPNSELEFGSHLIMNNIVFALTASPSTSLIAACSSALRPDTCAGPSCRAGRAVCQHPGSFRWPTCQNALPTMPLLGWEQLFHPDQRTPL